MLRKSEGEEAEVMIIKEENGVGKMKRRRRRRQKVFKFKCYNQYWAVSVEKGSMYKHLSLIHI